jgi:hypothetical protein
MHDSKIAGPKLEARPNVCEFFGSYRLMTFKSWTCWYRCVDLLVELMQNLLSDIIEWRRLALISCALTGRRGSLF